MLVAAFSRKFISITRFFFWKVITWLITFRKKKITSLFTLEFNSKPKLLNQLLNFQTAITYLVGYTSKFRMILPYISPKGKWWDCHNFYFLFFWLLCHKYLQKKQRQNIIHHNVRIEDISHRTIHRILLSVFCAMEEGINASTSPKHWRQGFIILGCQVITKNGYVTTNHHHYLTKMTI